MTHCYLYWLLLVSQSPTHTHAFKHTHTQSGLVSHQLNASTRVKMCLPISIEAGGCGWREWRRHVKIKRRESKWGIRQTESVRAEVRRKDKLKGWGATIPQTRPSEPSAEDMAVTANKGFLGRGGGINPPPCHLYCSPIEPCEPVIHTLWEVDGCAFLKTPRPRILPFPWSARIFYLTDELFEMWDMAPILRQWGKTRNPARAQYIYIYISASSLLYLDTKIIFVESILIERKTFWICLVLSFNYK